MQKNKLFKPQSHGPTSKTIQQQIVTHSFQGPIPPPEILSGYNNIIPDGAERILKLAESETGHRQKMEQKALDAEIEGLKNEAKDTMRGQFFGLVIGLATILSSAYMSVNGAQIAGGFMGTTGLVGLVSVFVIGRRRSNSKSTSKNKEIAEKEVG